MSSLFKKILVGVLVVVIWAGYSACSVGTDTELTDISNNWAHPQISYLVHEGIIKGYTDNTFRPDNPITRAEFITIVNRTFRFEAAGGVSFSDVKRWNWYYADVGRAEYAGYLPDIYSDKLNPDQHISRAEVASIITSVLKLIAAENKAKPFEDISSISSQFRQSILAVTQNDYMSGYPDGTFRPLDPITRAEAVSIMYNCLRPVTPPTSTTNVKNFGAKGDGQADDTGAIQKAINYAHSSGGGFVYLPEGTYMVDATISLKLKDDVHLRLDEKAILRAKPTYKENYAVIQIRHAANVVITGGSIVGERYEHLGTSGEWGMGISILGSTNIKISGVSISDCWGDGIYIDGSTDNPCSQNITIEQFTLSGNRRQGISVISAKDLIIRDGTISDTHGTRPQSGLDFEPDHIGQYLENILVEDLITENNAGYGIECWFGCGTTNATRFPVDKVDIIIKNHTDKGSKGGTLHNIPYYIREGYNIEVIGS